jgi:hypothetical protein
MALGKKLGVVGALKVRLCDAGQSAFDFCILKRSSRRYFLWSVSTCISTTSSTPTHAVSSYARFTALATRTPIIPDESCQTEQVSQDSDAGFRLDERQHRRRSDDPGFDLQQARPLAGRKGREPW